MVPKHTVETSSPVSPRVLYFMFRPAALGPIIWRLGSQRGRLAPLCKRPGSICRKPFGGPAFASPRPRGFEPAPEIGGDERPVLRLHGTPFPVGRLAEQHVEALY